MKKSLAKGGYLVWSHQRLPHTGDKFGLTLIGNWLRGKGMQDLTIKKLRHSRGFKHHWEGVARSGFVASTEAAVPVFRATSMADAGIYKSGCWKKVEQSPNTYLCNKL